MNLSKKRTYAFNGNLSEKTEYCYPEKDIKNFIKRRIIDLEREQKQAKGNDWKRSLLLLKANLEKDAGDKLFGK